LSRQDKCVKSRNHGMTDEACPKPKPKRCCVADVDDDDEVKRSSLRDSRKVEHVTQRGALLCEVSDLCRAHCDCRRERKNVNQVY